VTATCGTAVASVSHVWLVSPKFTKFARQIGQGENMKKIALVVLAVISMAVITGCRASGEVDPHGASSIVAPR
jgi:hypothetical protein